MFGIGRFYFLSDLIFFGIVVHFKFFIYYSQVDNFQKKTVAIIISVDNLRGLAFKEISPLGPKASLM